MADSAKRHDDINLLIKEVWTAADETFRNQGVAINALENQIGQLAKVLQERFPGALPSTTKTNPRGHVKAISIMEESTCDSIITSYTNESPIISSVLLQDEHVLK